MKKFQTNTGKFLPGKQSLRKPMLILLGLFTSFAAVIITADNSNNVKAQVSQKPITGEWFADFNRSKSGEIHFTFQRRSEKGGFNMTGNNLRLSELQGLTIDARTSTKTDVNFNIVREAGTFACEGFFQNGKGVGFWTLTPSEKFVSTMRGRGYDNLTEEDLLSAALHNLTTKFIEDLKTAGYENLTFKELRRALTHDIPLEFIREMKTAGYEGLKMEELIRARNHNINGEYVKDVKAMGFERQPLEKLIRLRNHDITMEFINQMRSAGFENLSIEGLIRLKNHDITAAFISEIKAEGYSDVPAETAIRLKNHDVDRDFIRRAKAQGYSNTTLEELIRLRNRGTVK
jgi:hypothetical protein